MIPSFCNLLVELLKGTALVSIMGMGDLTFSGNLVRLALQESAEMYAYVLLIYFAIAFVITRLMRALERRLKAGSARRRSPPGPRRGARKPPASVRREVPHELGLGRGARLHAALLGRTAGHPAGAGPRLGDLLAPWAWCGRC